MKYAVYHCVAVLCKAFPEKDFVQMGAHVDLNPLCIFQMFKLLISETLKFALVLNLLMVLYVVDGFSIFQ